MKKNKIFENIKEIEKINEEEKPEKQSKIKKILIITIGIFMIFLMLSYVLVTSDALHGIIESKTAKNNQIQFKEKDLTIIFQNNTLKKLQQHYTENEQREIKACLYGEKKENKYYINNIFFPEVITASVIHIETIKCPEKTLIDLHSHPINRCLASEQDIKVLEKLKQENPDILMIIMCSKDRFAVV